MFIGLDVGGTKIRAVLMTRRGKVLCESIVLTQRSLGKEQVIEKILSLISNMLDPRVEGIGVAIAGFAKKGKVVFSPNLRITGVNLEKQIRKKFKLPVLIKNDAGCFALAEALFGSAKRARVVVGITLGTGVGGGLVIDRRIYSGNTTGIEVGTMIIRPDSKRKSSNGTFGCVEALCSGPNISKEYFAATKKRILAGDILKLKDPVAKRLTNELKQNLLLTFVNITNVLNPDVIVVGGGLRDLPFYKELNEEIRKHEIKYLTSRVEIKRTKLNEYAGAVGAAALFLQ